MKLRFSVEPRHYDTDFAAKLNEQTWRKLLYDHFENRTETPFVDE